MKLHIIQKRKTPRMDRNARLLLLALFQIKEENGESQEFSKDLLKAMKRIKGGAKIRVIECYRVYGPRQ